MVDRQLSPPPAEKRDRRVDFFRGVALYMILVDHVMDDPLGKFTFQAFGFSDASELFVFLSGISCAIVYPRLLARSGWRGLMTAVAWRIAKIYAFYIVTSAIVIFAVGAAASLTPADFANDPFTAIVAAPLSALWQAALLTSPPALPGILVLYLGLTAAAIPAFLWLARRGGPGLALAASAAIWLVAQVDPDLAPHVASQSISIGWGGSFYSASACSSGCAGRRRRRLAIGPRTLGRCAPHGVS